jgi:superfamily II DNA or RNA helicase
MALVQDNYLYVRNHPAYQFNNAVKIGSTTNLGARDMAYATGEIVRGEFIRVFKLLDNTPALGLEVPVPSLDDAPLPPRLLFIEKMLHRYLTKLGHHIYLGGGMEFFNTAGIGVIESFLADFGIAYVELSGQEIKDILLEYKNNITWNKTKLCVEKYFKRWLDKVFNKKKSKLIVPLPHQQEVLDRIPAFYNVNEIGKLLWACGMGKALMGLLIAGILRARNIVIGVPSIYLQGQMVREVVRVFQNAEVQLIGGRGGTTNPAVIKRILAARQQQPGTLQRELESGLEQVSERELVMITTYDSCYILADVAVETGFQFDFKIGDEAHHLVAHGKEDEFSNESYIRFHDIPAQKALFMTATPKFYIPRVVSQESSSGGTSASEYVIYSMNDERLFGKCIDSKPVRWAIDNGKITDYRVMVLYNTVSEVEEIIRRFKLEVRDMELFVAAFMVLKSLEKYEGDLSHILIYTNTTENSDIVIGYVRDILALGIVRLGSFSGSARDDIYTASLHSNTSGCKLDMEVGKFSKARIGIIACVYIFGEGFDLPRLNGVAFAENMISPIRTMQCALRPNRLDKERPEKVAFVIIPYLDREERGINTASFKKCFTILDRIRNDDDILEYRNKITVASLVLEDLENPRDLEPVLDDKLDDITKPIEPGFEEDIEEQTEKEKNDAKNASVILRDNPDELEKLKLRMKYSTRLKNRESPEKDEYEYMKFLNRQLGISSKVEYNDSSRRGAFGHWVASPDIYFARFGVWVNWYDYLGVDTSGFIQDKEQWLEYCRLHNITNYKEYYELQKIKKELPVYPEDLYIEFTNIDYELNKKNSIRRRR